MYLQRSGPIMLIKIILGASLIYLGLCVLLYIFQNQFIFFPTPLSPQERKKLQELYPGTDIEMTTKDGVPLQGWLHRAPNHLEKPLILYYGGNAEQVWLNLEDLAKFKDASLLFMNYRGYGASGDKPSEKKLFADALFVFDKMVEEKGFNPDKVILMGRSLGTGVAVYVASQRKVQGLILVSPFDSLVSVGKKAYPIFPVGAILKHRFDSLSRAPNIEAPLLALAAEEDSIVPLKASKNLVSHWKDRAQLVIIPRREHNDIHFSDLYWRTIQNFLDKLVSDTKRPFGV